MTKISNQYSLTNILTADLANSRLGINNVSPAYSLDLTGTARVTSSFYLPSLTTNYIPKIGTSGLLGNSVIYDDGTSIGIGTTTNLNFGVTGTVGISVGGSSAYGGMQIRNTTGNLELFVGGDGATDAFIRNNMNGVLRFGTNGSERMRIFANGNVAIGSSTDNGNKLQVTGAISASGNINGANIGGSSFSMSFGSSFNFGTGYLKSSTNGITVTTSTTTIYTSTNIGGVLSGNLVVVTGVRSGNGVNFVDLILYMNSGSISVISSQVFGSPPGRSYSVSNENLNLSMASGSYVVACVALIQGYTNP